MCTIDQIDRKILFVLFDSKLPLSFANISKAINLSVGVERVDALVFKGFITETRKGDLKLFVLSENGGAYCRDLRRSFIYSHGSRW
jgi:hypothetical protein